MPPHNPPPSPRSPAQEVHRLVVGPEGSWVLLGLRMGLQSGDGLVHVALQRRRVLSGEDQLKMQMIRLQARPPLLFLFFFFIFFKWRGTRLK